MVEKARALKIGTYASLAQAVLERCIKEHPLDVVALKKLLSSSYNYQAIAGVETDNGQQSLVNCKAWIELVLERIEKFNNRDDALELAEAYNESGMAYMRSGQENQAEDSWKQSIESFANVPGSTILDQTFPSIHLGIFYSIRGEGGKGDEVLQPVVKAREDAYGKDDTTSMV